ncbi:MAG TPA: phage integrase N-terminal SAM-like domain-containing protein [Bryobacteraceae bacterium]
MTQLRKITLEELVRRNYTESTTRAYIHTIEDYARYFNRPPNQLGPEHIREYVAHLFRDLKLADNTVNQRIGALRFFYIKTLKKSWNIEETPYPKKRFYLPVILSQDEVAHIIESADSPFHHTILMTLYGTRVRRAELAHLQVSDVDSQRMVIHVQGGKGRKDRDVMLSPNLLEICENTIGACACQRLYPKCAHELNRSQAPVGNLLPPLVEPHRSNVKTHFSPRSNSASTIQTP